MTDLSASFSVDGRHRLLLGGEPVAFRKTPNGGASLIPRFLVMHYTAGRDAASAIRWFEDPAAKASAHLVIARDGGVTQLQAFNRTCWHAGVSRWGELDGLNAHSIGIELDNEGMLDPTGDGTWRTWFETVVEPARVLVAPHGRGGPPRGWARFADRQIEVASAIAAALHARYRFVDILGHDDISWPRKTDPGPAFPMRELRRGVLGRD